MLATSPQNPDSAELITAALHGGVLHRPGFPLQAWIDRALVHIPLFPPARSLAIFSLLAQGVTLAFLYRLLRALRLSPVAILVSLACYSLFPPVWHVSVQPEKYTLAMAFMALALFQIKQLTESENPSLLGVIACGLSLGLGFSEHVLFGLLAPAVVFACVKLRRPRKIAALLVPAIVTAAAFYASFLLLTSETAWPDWGKPQNLAEAFAPVVSAGGDFVTMTGKATNNSAFVFFFEDFIRSFTVLGLLLPLGLFSLARSRKRYELFAILACFVGCVLLLVRCRAEWPELITHTYFERYGVFAMFFASLLMAIGYDEVAKKIPQRLASFAVAAIVAFTGLLAFSGYERADASRDITLDVYRESLESSLPARAFYVAGNDVEGFYGLRTTTGYRFPIVNLDFPWYRQRVIKVIEPRLKSDSPDPPGVEAIIEIAYAKGYEVYSTDANALIAPDRIVQQRGLFWVIGKNIKAPLGEQTVEAAQKVCQVLVRMRPSIPTEGHYLSQALWANIRQAFFGAQIYLRSKGEAERAALAEKIARALFDGREPEAWLADCGQFAGMTPNRQQ